MLRELANLDKDSLIKEIRRLRKENKDMKQRINELMESLLINQSVDMSAHGVIEDDEIGENENDENENERDVENEQENIDHEKESEDILDSDDIIDDIEESIYNEPLVVDEAAFVAEYGFTLEEAITLHKEYEESQKMLQESQNAMTELQDLVSRQHNCLLEMDEKMALQSTNYKDVETMVESLRTVVAEKDNEADSLRSMLAEKDLEMATLRQAIAENDRIRDEDYKAYKTEQAHLVQAYEEKKAAEEAYKTEQLRLVQANNRLLDLCSNLDGVVNERDLHLTSADKRCKDMELKLEDQMSQNIKLVAANLELERLLSEMKSQLTHRNDQIFGFESVILALSDQ